MGLRRNAASAVIASVCAAGALALIALALAAPPRLDGPLLQRALVLLVVTAVAELVAIRVAHADSGELLTLFELAVVADLVLLPPVPAVVTALGGLAIALVVQRRPPVKFAFNVGQYALGLVPAAALYHGTGARFEANAGLLALFAGMSVFVLVNLLTISAIIAATSGRSFTSVVRQEGGISLAMGLGNSSVGMVAVALYLNRPALTPAVLAPAVALHLAFRGWVRAKELSARMQEETDKLGRILEHSSEGIVLADSDGLVLLWSPSMERATGVPAREAEGKALAYLLRGRDANGALRAVDVATSSEPTDLEIIAADGSARWLRIQHGPGYDGDGRLTFDVLVVTDVTRQREVERLKDDFFSTVSHELRTPLTPIKGYAALLLRRGDEIPSERRQDALRAIVERTDHLARLVEDLLLASKVSSGDRRLPEVARQPVALAELAERALRPFRDSYPTRVFTLSGDAPVAMADPVRVEQVLAGLVSNAVKFSEDGTAVEVTLAREGAETVLSVRDEGRGIPAHAHEMIFDKFKRLEDPLRMETSGAGLGLFIVKQLVTAMGGRVSVDSELGRGSVFTVRLPAAAEARAELAG